jgi:hypothetical protein
LKSTEFHLSLLEEYSARSVVPSAIRCYLRVKSGFMQETFSFRKYHKVWCLLADQHLLVFRDAMDLHPQRIIYLYGHCWKTYRVCPFFWPHSSPPDFCQTAASLCIAFEFSSEKTAKLFYKFETPEECQDWFELLRLLSHESIGPCESLFTNPLTCDLDNLL